MYIIGNVVNIKIYGNKLYYVVTTKVINNCSSRSFSDESRFLKLPMLIIIELQLFSTIRKSANSVDIMFSYNYLEELYMSH